MSEPEIIQRLIHIEAGMTSFERVRFAVSADEFMEIRAYCMKRDGKFFSRIRNVPLIVEEFPDTPLLAYEEV